MKRPVLIPCVLSALLLLCPLRVNASVPAPDGLSAKAAVLMDADTGQVLYEKNAGARRAPASITKILTGLLVLENLDTGDTLTVSEQAVDMPSWGSNAGLKAGEKLTVEEAMYAMMLRSANEAANVLAEGVAGTQEDFAELMNRRAQELGATDTFFTNAHGLSGRGHYTTACDMAIITRQALATTGFSDYFGADRYAMAATNKSGVRFFTHTHRMLLESYAQYDDEVIGGKTGYTMPAGYTLVTAARREGRTLICVVMGSDTIYADTRTLLDFGFDEFIPYTHRLAEDSPGEATIWDGEREAGRVSFSWPESVDLWLHDSLEPENVAAKYDYPEKLAKGEAIEGTVGLRIADSGIDGLPETLITLPLEAEVVEFPPPAVAVTAVVAPEEAEDDASQRGDRKSVV